MRRTCIAAAVAVILIVCAGMAAAAEVAYSDRYPKIQRLQGVVLFPAEIEQVAVETEDGAQATHYRYQLYRVKDVGQRIHQDRAAWAQENKALLYELTYGDLETVVKAIEADTVETLKTDAEAKLKAIEPVDQVIEEPIKTK